MAVEDKNAINFFETGLILYASSIDLSLPKGASVNEREFCWGLHKLLGDRVGYLIPKPQRDVADLRDYRISFLKECDYRSPYRFLLHQLHFGRKLRRAIISRKYDLVVTRLGWLPIGFWFGIKGTGIPVAIKHLTGKTNITSTADNFLTKSTKYALGVPHRMIVGKITKNIIGADTPTVALLRGIMRAYSLDLNEVILVENATNTNRFRPCDKYAVKEVLGLSKFDPIVGYVGGRPWERGGYEMLSAAPAIVKRFPKVGFVIVGGGNGMADLLDQIRSSGWGGYFHCPGVVDYVDVPLYINSFDVGIAFDQSDRFSEVGNSNQKVRQYISCGKPVIVTPGGNDFIISNNLGSVMEAQDSEAMIDALIRWLSLDGEGKAHHAWKAAAFARENLSIERAVMRRIEFWNKRLQSYRGRASI